MKLLHCTDYRGGQVLPHTAKQDHAVDLPLIWTQAVRTSKPCCPGFGYRTLPVPLRLLAGWDADPWGLWTVGGAWGRNRGHYFHKLVLVPTGHPGLGKRNLRSRGWLQVIAALDPTGPDVKGVLQAALGTFWDPGDTDTNHVHIGIYTGGDGFSVPPDWTVYTCDDCGRNFSEEDYADAGVALRAQQQHTQVAHHP